MPIPTGFNPQLLLLPSSICNHQQATRGRPSALQKGPSPALPADPHSACVQALFFHHFGAALVQQAAASSKRELTSLLPRTLPSLLHPPTQYNCRLSDKPPFVRLAEDVQLQRHPAVKQARRMGSRGNRGRTVVNLHRTPCFLCRPPLDTVRTHLVVQGQATTRGHHGVSSSTRIDL